LATTSSRYYLNGVTMERQKSIYTADIRKIDCGKQQKRNYKRIPKKNNALRARNALWEGDGYPKQLQSRNRKAVQTKNDKKKKRLFCAPQTN